MLREELTPELRQAAISYDTENLLDVLDITDEEMQAMADAVVTMFDEDFTSRSGWMESNERWIKLASQLIEQKNYPWQNASNVKYPLLSTTALQFHARAYPALIPDGQLVKLRIIGMDKDNAKKDRASRVGQHMSYQLLDQSDTWQEDMDRLLYILPIVGLAHKKTYYSPLDGMNKSVLVMADELVINYHAREYKKAVKTQIIPLTENDVHELQISGFYRDVELTHSGNDTAHMGVEDDITGLQNVNRSNTDDGGNSYDDTPFSILESHTFYDLDGDGYKEPLIITVERHSKTLLRVSRRYNPWDVLQDQKGNIIKITPKEYFTSFGFLPNPESAIYYNGFGSLLGPINAASNTILNQLVDAGHLATVQGGFLGKGIRVKGGRLSFQPGEWKVVQSTGTDIKNNIYPLPVKEPSNVLFQLLGMLIQSGERLASVKDIMVGDNPGQNQPYATTVAVLEQGMKVFVGIYKRIYRALTKEYKQWYALNSIYLAEEDYFNVIDDASGRISLSDYSLVDSNIVPNADPSIVSEAHKMMKAQSLLQKKASGLPINTMELTRRVLEVEGHEDIPSLMQPEEHQEDPKITLERQKLLLTTKLEYDRLNADMERSRFEAFKDYAQAMAFLSKAALDNASTERSDFAQVAEFATQEYKAITERMNVLQKDLQSQRQHQMAQQQAEQDSAEEESSETETE